MIQKMICIIACCVSINLYSSYNVYPRDIDHAKQIFRSLEHQVAIQDKKKSNLIDLNVYKNFLCVSNDYEILEKEYHLSRNYVVWYLSKSKDIGYIQQYLSMYKSATVNFIRFIKLHTDYSLDKQGLCRKRERSLELRCQKDERPYKLQMKEDQGTSFKLSIIF